MMVFFSHPSERLDRKEREREQLGADREGRERVGERERERSFFVQKKFITLSTRRVCVVAFFGCEQPKKRKKADVSS